MSTDPLRRFAEWASSLDTDPLPASLDEVAGLARHALASADEAPTTTEEAA